MACREKTSMRNFMQEIEELDKLKLHRKFSRQTLTRGQSHAVLENKESIIKKCSLKNLNIYKESDEEFRAKIAQAKSKLSKPSKKHILDRILTRF